MHKDKPERQDYLPVTKITKDGAYGFIQTRGYVTRAVGVVLVPKKQAKQ